MSLTFFNRRRRLKALRAQTETKKTAAEKPQEKAKKQPRKGK